MRILAFFGGVIGTFLKVAGLFVVVIWAFLAGHNLGGTVVGVLSLIFFVRAYTIIVCLILYKRVPDIENTYYEPNRFWW